MIREPVDELETWLSYCWSCGILSPKRLAGADQKYVYIVCIEPGCGHEYAERIET